MKETKANKQKHNLGMPDYTHHKRLNQFGASMNIYPNAKNKLHISTLTWDISDSPFWSNLGLPRHAWPHPLK